MSWYRKKIFAKTLYHGTSINNYNSIKNIGLVPDTGDFVKDMYEGDYQDAGVEFDPVPVTYATDKEDLSKAVTAMVYAVSKYLGRGLHDVTSDEIRGYGMLVLIREGEKYYEQRPHEEIGPYKDWQGETDNRYPAVEPGDYYSEDATSGDILIGNKLVEFLKKHEQWPISWIGQGIEELRNLLLTMAIQYHVQEQPSLKNRIINQVKEKVKNLDAESVKKYYREYKQRMGN